MKTNLFFSILTLALLASCTKEEKSGMPHQCNESNTEFRQLYESMTVAPAHDDLVTMDLESHQYDFEVSAPAMLCKIGYQSLPDFNSTPYSMSISDQTNGSLLYIGTHLFSSATTSYEAIDPILLQPGITYSIRRTQTQWNGNIGNTIGRLVKHDDNSPLAFPIVQGDLIITGTSFFGTGGPVNDWAIPFIDLVFE